MSFNEQKVKYPENYYNPNEHPLKDLITPTSYNKGNLIKVSAYDTARVRDFFCQVGAVVSRQQIQVIGCRFWHKTDFMNVAKDISDSHAKFKWDYHVCESNMGGMFVHDVMRKVHGINFEMVQTVKEVKKQSKLREGKSMPKYTTIDWMEYARMMEILKFPPQETWTPGIIELNRQLGNYVAKATGSGVKYENEAPDDHDDGVMALALVVHKARTSLLQLGTVGDNMFATYSAETVGDPPQMDQHSETKAERVIGERLRKSQSPSFKLSDVRLENIG